MIVEVLVSNFSTVKVVQLGSPSWERSVLQLAPGCFVPLVVSAYPKQSGTRSPAGRSLGAALHSSDSVYLYALCWKRIKSVHYTLIYITILWGILGCKISISLYTNISRSIPPLWAGHLFPSWWLWLDSPGHSHDPIWVCQQFLWMASHSLNHNYGSSNGYIHSVVFIRKWASYLLKS